MSITNNSIRSWCGAPRSDIEFYVDKVDSIRPNENTLMFLNKGMDIYNLDKVCKNCVFLLDSKIYGYYKSYPSMNNDFVLVSNPKYRFCIVVEKLGLPSRFQYDGEEEKIVGRNCHIDSGVILGGIDFSPVVGNTRDELVQFPQMGGVKLGDNIVIKYNTMIGKGTFGYTIICDNTMIDFGCQIGHNCQIGKSCIIAAGTIIGGSTVIGDCTTIGIGAKIRNGLHIGNNVSIGMGSVVIRDVPDNVTVVGNPARVIDHKPIFDEKGLV